MKYTKGPWKFNPKNGFVEAMNSFGHTVCVADVDDSEADINVEANGALIAAAPEILEALTALWDEIHASGCSHYMNEASDCADIFNLKMKNAERIIYKAEGRK